MKHQPNMLDAALTYADLGYRVFPCAPGSKRPLTANGFHDATTDFDQIDAWWVTWPNANIGIPTDGHIVIDIDGADNPWLKDKPEKQNELADAPRSLTANDGFQYIFNQPPGKSWRNTTGKIAPKVDTRGDGGYIVVPPSVLEGDKQYRWQPTCELDVPPEQLPQPPAWLVELLDSIAASSTEDELPADGNAIPDGQRNSTLASLAGSMRRVGMTRSEIFAALRRVNLDRCHPPLDDNEVSCIASSVARYAPDGIATAVAENHYAKVVDPSEAPPPAFELEDPGPFPDELLEVPGFVRQVMNHTLATAPYPQPLLAFAGALSLQAFLGGRKVRDAADNRTNLYVLALANSGAGKDHPRKVNQKVLLASDLPEHLGDTFASGEGIEDRMFAQPSMLFQTDEIDGLMNAINRTRDARHESILNVLLKMYTSSGSLYPMRVKAGKQSRGVIDQPSLCMYGTAVPRYFYEALSMRMLNNGFFARLLIVEADRRGMGQDIGICDLPDRVVDTANWWAKYGGGGQRANLAGWHPKPTIIEATHAANELFTQLREYADEQYVRAEDRDNDAAMAIWARAYEKARKLALVYAVSENHLKPTIGDKAVQWAWSFVDYQTRRMLYRAAQHVSEGEFDGKCKRMIEILTAWHKRRGENWMPHWEMSRRLKWSDREIDEVRDALLGQALIEYEFGSSVGGGRVTSRYRSMSS